MYKSIDLNKEFATRNEMFAAIKANKDEIIAMKKSTIYNSIDKHQLSCFNIEDKTIKGFDTKENYIHPIINTTNIVDSHLDCHKDGIWNKSIKEQQGKIRYSLDHSKNIADVIAYPKDVHMRLVNTSFKDIGYDLQGSTQALVFDINIDVIDNETALKVIHKHLPVENSVSMQYVKIELAMNSDRKEDVEEKKRWDDNIDSVANKDFAMEQGVMWLVYEAKIVNESSMVTQGSNSYTRIIYGNKENSSTQDKALEDQAAKALEEKQAADREKKEFYLNLLKK